MGWSTLSSSEDVGGEGGRNGGGCVMCGRSCSPTGGSRRTRHSQLVVGEHGHSEHLFIGHLVHRELVTAENWTYGNFVKICLSQVALPRLQLRDL